MACNWRSRESGGVSWQYAEGAMQASIRMSMRRPDKVDIWRRFLDKPTWWAVRDELH